MAAVLEEYKVTALTTKNKIIDVTVGKCQHCDEIVPKVGSCPDCDTVYEHTNTVEDPETGYLHFIYECSGCPPANRKAQKVIKICDGYGRKTTDELIKNFL